MTNIPLILNYIKILLVLRINSTAKIADLRNGYFAE